MPRYRGGNTGFPAVNAAMGAEFARNGGLMGMFGGSPDDRRAKNHDATLLAIQKLVGEQALAQGKQQGEMNIAGEDAKAENEILKALNFSRNDLKDPAKKAIYDQIVKVRGASNLNTAKTDEATTRVQAERAGVPNVQANPGMDAGLKAIIGSAQNASANAPFVAAQKASDIVTPFGAARFNPAEANNPLTKFMSPGPMMSSDTMDPTTGMPVKTSLQSPSTIQNVPTPEEIRALEAKKAAMTAQAVPNMLPPQDAEPAPTPPRIVAGSGTPFGGPVSGGGGVNPGNQLLQMIMKLLSAQGGNVPGRSGFPTSGY